MTRKNFLNRILAIATAPLALSACKSGEEQAVYIEELLGAVADETPEQKAFFARRRKAGRGVGTDADGKIVRQADIKSA